MASIDVVATPDLARIKDLAASEPGLDLLVLFGSRARGDARPDSDYDVAVFLKDLDNFGQEAGRIAEIETDILYDTGAIINAMPFKAGSYQEHTGLIRELRREGLDL